MEDEKIFFFFIIKMKTHDFTQQQIQQKFNTIYGDIPYKQKVLPKLKGKVKGQKNEYGVDLAVELAFYDAFKELPPFLNSIMEGKKNKLKQLLKALID
jgi:16S rRNA G966 N2-methylase RsmD